MPRKRKRITPAARPRKRTNKVRREILTLAKIARDLHSHSDTLTVLELSELKAAETMLSRLPLVSKHR